jgi:hypothetical protein
MGKLTSEGEKLVERLTKKLRFAYTYGLASVPYEPEVEARELILSTPELYVSKDYPFKNEFGDNRSVKHYFPLTVKVEVKK